MEDTTREEERFSFSLHSNSKRRRVDGLDLNRIPKPKEDSFFLLAALSNQVKVWWSGSGQGPVVQLCGTFRPETLRGTSIHHITSLGPNVKTHTPRGRGRATVNPIHSTELWAETNFLFFPPFFSFHHFSTLHRIASASDYPPHLFSRK